MTEERLQSLSVEELHYIAKKHDIEDHQDLSRLELIEIILEIMEEEKQERFSDNNSIISIEEKKFEIIKDEELDFQEEDPFPLPEKYNETELFFLLRDPSWAFAYWNIAPNTMSDYKSDPSFEELFFRVYELTGPQYAPKNVIDYYEIPLALNDTSRYINLPHAESYYCVELIARYAAEEKSILRSQAIYSPKDTFHSEEGEQQQNLKKILKLSGLYSSSVSSFGMTSFGEGADGRRVPQRIISFADVQTFRPKG